MSNTDEKEKPTSGKGNILVMDDEKIIREMMDQMLSRLGYNVAVARDGAEAVECYQKAKDCGKPYDIVILDLTVKEGIGGREAIRRLIEIDPNVKGIVTSGGFDDPGIKEYKEYGFKGIVMKPYSINELSTILNKMMMEY